MTLDVTKSLEGKYPPGNTTMTELDHRLYNLVLEIEQLKQDLYIDRHVTKELKMKCHMNFPCDIGNLGIDLFRIATLLNEGDTHNGK